MSEIEHDKTLASGPTTGAIGSDEPTPGAAVLADTVQLASDPTRIGRYVIVDRIGAGGMGIVYSAFDPDLDRKIAIKLLRPDASQAAHDTKARSRLLREAQALAKVSHPNVIQVFDVGTHDDEVYVAMEFVQGQTLKDWRERKPRGWREILDVYLLAGKGLAAAHAAGLVHRDFKPENVLIGDDRRVRVLDFGLARATGSDTALLDTVARLEAQPTDDKLTRTGALSGTPAYMAPEQFAGKETDPRTDQFSFCVAVLEALDGRRPFSGDSLAELNYAVQNGEIESAPKSSQVPGKIRDALVRGLSADPKQRWPDMNGLLSVLQPASSASRTRWVTSVALVAAVGTGGWALLSAGDADLCGGAANKWAGIWDESRRADLHEQFQQTGVPYAEAAFSGVESTLDGYVSKWSETYRDACEATQLRGEQSESLMDLRMQCLERARTSTAALLDVFASADSDTVQRSIQAVQGLSDVARCSDAGSLMSQVPLPTSPDTIAAVDRVRELLDQADASDKAGKYADASGLIDEAQAISTEFDYAPVRAEVLNRRGVVSTHRGEYEPAAEALQEAYWTAMESKHDEVMASAASWLVYVVGKQLERHEEGLQWWRHADAASKRVGEPPAQRARLHANRGLIRESKGELDAAKEDYELALELYGTAYGGKHSNLATTHVNLGAIAQKQGDYPTARAHYETALQMRIDLLGGDHPEVGSAHANLGTLSEYEGNLEQVHVHYEKALDILRRNLGEEHPKVGALWSNLGSVAHRLGDVEEARKNYSRAHAIWTASFGPDHPRLAYAEIGLGEIAEADEDLNAAERHYARALELRENAVGKEHRDVADALVFLGNLYSAKKQYEKAITTHQRARDIYVEVVGADHPFVGMALNNLGMVQLAAGDAQSALDTFTETLEIWEKTIGLDHPDTAATLGLKGEALSALGRHREAIEPLEASLKLRDTPEMDGRLKGWSRFNLSQALWKSNVDRTRAKVLATQALAEMRSSETSTKEEIETLEAWRQQLGL